MHDCKTSGNRGLSPIILGTYLILGAGLVHFLAIGILDRIPRPVGGALITAYGYFMYAGLIQ